MLPLTDGCRDVLAEQERDARDLADACFAPGGTDPDTIDAEYPDDLPYSEAERDRMADMLGGNDPFPR